MYGKGERKKYLEDATSSSPLVHSLLTDHTEVKDHAQG